MHPEGFLLINKAEGTIPFHIIPFLRKLSGIQKIGHGGTLDPFATGVMVYLIGKTYTKNTSNFQEHDKEYEGRLLLGKTTPSYDKDTEESHVSDAVPTLEELEKVLKTFQGKIEQIPPMFSAKKVHGKKLYELARKGIEIERKPIHVFVETRLLSYTYPFVDLSISCSKGTYIRSIANDIGQKLNTGAYLYSLLRTRQGPFVLKDCLEEKELYYPTFSLKDHLRK